MSALLGLAGLVILIGALVVILNAMRNTPQSESGLFRSPVESLPSPLETPAPPSQSTPVGQPAMPPAMATKAAMAAIVHRQTPKSQSTLRPIHTSQDIIDAVLTAPGFQANLDDPIFGPHSKGATPGEPIRVRLISKQYQGQYYYIVPFYKQIRVTGLATVWVENGRGGMGMWGNADDARFPPVSAAEAVELVKTDGRQVTGDPELVFRPTRENGGDWTSPFWEVKTVEGTTFYVMYILGATRVYRADEIHTID
jgi:hypothetical protein